MINIKKNNYIKTSAILFLLTFLYLLFFHFIFHNLDRNIHSFPEIEELIIFYSLIINDGFIESYDHTGYPLFILLSQLFKLLKFSGLLKIASISDSVIFDVYSNDIKKLYFTLRIFSFILNLLTYYLIILILDKLQLKNFSKILIIFFILIIPNLNYLFIGSLTSGFGLVLFLLSIIFFMNSQKKYNIFFGTLFLLLAVQCKIQFLPYLFIIPSIYLVLEYFGDNKRNNSINLNKKNTYIIFLLFLILFLLSIIFIFILLYQKNILSNFQYLILLFFIFSNLLYYWLQSNKLLVLYKSSQIYFAFFISIVFLTIKFHPNNFFVIFDPINTNDAYFHPSSELIITNISNHLIFLTQTIKIFIIDFLNYKNLNNILLGNFYNQFPTSQPLYFFLIIFILISLIKNNFRLFIINFMSLIFLLISIKINKDIRPWPDHFWYLIYTDIIVLGIFIYNIKVLNNMINFLRIINLFFIIVLIFNNLSFFNRMTAISSFYGFDNNKSISYYTMQHCDRLPYLNRIQKKYDLLKAKSYYVDEYVNLKKIYIQKHFKMCLPVTG